MKSTILRWFASDDTAMKSTMLRWFGVVLILEIGLIHMMTAQGEYDKAPYLGYLFAANFFGALIAALGIAYRQLWGWILGLLIAVGSIAGYIWSRTVGMPGVNVEFFTPYGICLITSVPNASPNIEEWYAPYGIVSLVAEGLFLLLAGLRPWKLPEPSVVPSSNPRLRSAPQMAGVLVIALVAFTAYQWDANVTQAFGHHVGSLNQIQGTAPTTQAELEQKYGIRVSLVAISMMNSIVDVRLKITDPQKANTLLQNQAALLVGQQTLILVPHMHGHRSALMNPQRIVGMFFPTQQLIHTGSEVSLVLGNVRTEPIVVQ
jgi:hypothetical protein